MSTDSDSDQRSTPSKKKTYNLDFKLKVIKDVEKHDNKSKAAKEFKVDVRRVREWCGQKAQIESQLNMPNSNTFAKRLQGAGRPLKNSDFNHFCRVIMSTDSDSDQQPTPSKKKTYDLKFKLKVIKYVEKHGNKSKAAKEFEIDIRRVREWCGQRAQIESKLNMSNSNTFAKRIQGAGRPLKDSDFDERMINWAREQRQKKIRVSRTMIQKQALIFSTNENFKASNGWLQKFMARHT